MTDSKQILEQLQQGNKRFLEAINNAGSLNISLPSLPSAKSQTPFAVIVSCSDSRVSPELVFACGLGEIFVVRVAGNIITETELGSIEFACQKFGTRLIVVLGHSNCGAVAASISASKASGDTKSKEGGKQEDESHMNNIAALVEQINPAIETTINAGVSAEADDFHEQVANANVRLVADNIISRSSILKSMKSLNIVGAKYILESGQVTFFD